MTEASLKEIGQFTSAQVRDALLSDGRVIRFRYMAMNDQGDLKGFIAGVTPGGRINYNWLADIKRICNFRLTETTDVPTGWINWESLNFARDRVKIYAQLASGSDWISFPLGVFLMDSSARATDGSSRTREVKGFDLLKVLHDDKILARLVVAAGANIVTTVIGIIQGAKLNDVNIPSNAGTLTAERSWDPGTPKLKIINDLLNQINYGSLYFDENGTAVSRPYLIASLRYPDFTYETNDESILAADAEETFDLFEVPNVWTMVVSQPDRAALTSTFTNDSGNSPTSTINRGRSIVDFDTSLETVNQAELDKLVRNKAHDASQVYQHITFSTAIMPLHGENNLIRLTHDPLELADNYSETEWAITLRHGSLMTHKARKVINLD